MGNRATKHGYRHILTLAGTPPRAYTLTKPTTVIGRSADCDIRIDEANVSRIHAEIRLAEEGCRIIDRSSNGTFVNGRKITDCLLQPGDQIVIGSTALTLSVEEKRSWIIPQRAGFRCVQLTLVSALLCAILFGYPLGNVATYWGDAWDEMIANARAGISQYSPAVTETPSLKPEAQNQQRTRKQSPENIARETPPAPDRSERADDFQERSRGAVESLRKKIMDDLAANDLELAEVHLESFKKSEFYHLHLDAVQEMEGKIAAFKSKVSAVERERLAKIEERWKKVETTFREAVAAEQFDAARETLNELTDDPDVGSRAKALLLSVEGLKEKYLKETLSQRRDLFATLLLQLHPFLIRRDYAGATHMLDALINDSSCASHRPLIEREREALARAADGYREILDAIRRLSQGSKIAIEQANGPTLEGKFTEVKEDVLWIDHTHGAKLSAIAMKCLVTLANSQVSLSPSVIANLYLYDGDYASASLAAVDLAGTDLAAVGDFFIRMDLFQKALIGDEIDEAFARADKYVADGKPAMADDLLKAFAERYVPPVMEGVAMPDPSSLPEGIALHDGRLPQLDRIAKKREEIQSKIMVGNIPFRRLNILGEKGRTEEKITLLKSLKVACPPAAEAGRRVGEKALLSFIVRALDDDSAKVRLEAVRTLVAVGDGANTWDLAKMADDPVPEIAQSVLDGLEKIGARPEIIRGKYAAGGPDEQRLAVKVAGSIGKGNLEGTVREGLTNGDWRVRREAAIALAKLKAKSAGGALVVALRGERFDAVEAAIAYALGAIKHAGGIAPLADLLKRKPNHPFKREIVRAIGAIGGSEATNLLLGLLRDIDPWIRYEAVNGLAENHAQVNDDEVKHLLADDRWLVRAGALSAMIAGGKNKSLDTIVRSLDDPHPAVRATARQGLLSWSDAKVVPEIVKGVDGLGGEGLELALDILKRLTKQNFAVKKEWENWWKANGGAFRLPPMEERFVVKKEKP